MTSHSALSTARPSAGSARASGPPQRAGTRHYRGQQAGSGPATQTCAECGDFQSGDPSGLCYSCRLDQFGYRARQAAQVREFVTQDNKRLAEMGLTPHRASQVQRDDPGPYRFFWANVIRRPCPGCGAPTGTGFDRHDPGAATRAPTRCAGCAAAAITRQAQAESTHTGYPIAEQGPCAKCRQPTRRYGDEGRPLCPCCQPGAGVTPRPTGPGEARAPEAADIRSRELEAAL